VPSQFEVGGHVYRCERIDPFKQQNLVRRLAPLVSTLLATLTQQGLKQAPSFEALRPIITEFARMPDADMEYVMTTTLGVVLRKEGTSWSRVLVPGGGLAYEDVGLLELNEIIFNVLKDSLGPFFSGLAQKGLIQAAPSPGTTQ